MFIELVMPFNHLISLFFILIFLLLVLPVEFFPVRNLVNIHFFTYFFLKEIHAHVLHAHAKNVNGAKEYRMKSRSPLQNKPPQSMDLCSFRIFFYAHIHI